MRHSCSYVLITLLGPETVNNATQDVKQKPKGNRIYRSELGALVLWFRINLSQMVVELYICVGVIR